MIVFITFVFIVTAYNIYCMYRNTYVVLPYHLSLLRLESDINEGFYGLYCHSLLPNYFKMVWLQPFTFNWDYLMPKYDKAVDYSKFFKNTVDNR